MLHGSLVFLLMVKRMCSYNNYHIVHIPYCRDILMSIFKHHQTAESLPKELYFGARFNKDLYAGGNASQGRMFHFKVFANLSSLAI